MNSFLHYDVKMHHISAKKKKIVTF